MTCIDKTQNIYLNKILQKNFGEQKLPMEPANFQKNYPNFQSNIQRILANEESRQKAKNFVIQMRYKQQNSPYVRSEYNRNQNYLFSKTRNDFYDNKQRRNVIELSQENYYKNFPVKDLKKEII